jgi:hypothetical protein|tara:strand:- start:383 stop:505 length:123 start_codon:yes stop_codon:yes gene_type:complete
MKYKYKILVLDDSDRHIFNVEGDFENEEELKEWAKNTTVN